MNKKLRFIFPLSLFILSGILAYIATYITPFSERAGFDIWLGFCSVLCIVGAILGTIYAYGGFDD